MARTNTNTGGGSSDNIYTANGTLTGARSVDQNNHKLSLMNGDLQIGDYPNTRNDTEITYTTGTPVENADILAGGGVTFSGTFTGGAPSGGMYEGFIVAFNRGDWVWGYDGVAPVTFTPTVGVPFLLTEGISVTINAPGTGYGLGPLASLPIIEISDGAVNFLFTDIDGNVQSGDISSITGVSGGTIQGTNGRNLNIRATDEGIILGGGRGEDSVDLQVVRVNSTEVASQRWSTISGGRANTASATSSTVSGGNANTASSQQATVSGGSDNTASGNSSTVSGGNANTASGGGSTISGGNANIASGNNSTISGGNTNRTPSYGEWAGGLFTTEYTPANIIAWDSADRLFNIGNGTATGSRSDAFTILKSGQTAIGIDNFEANTDGNKLQVAGSITATLPAYNDDTAAGSAGLTTGQFFQTTGSGAAPLNAAGIIMIKQ